MKKLFIFIFIALIGASVAMGEKKVVLAPAYSWTMEQPTGLRTPSTVDTVFYNYAQRFVPGLGSDAWATTGNYGTEGQNMIWMDRPAMASDFFFKDAIERWLPTEKNITFYNTRIPMTLVSYSTGGARTNTLEHFGVRF